MTHGLWKMEVHLKPFLKPVLAALAGAIEFQPLAKRAIALRTVAMRAS